MGWLNDAFDTTVNAIGDIGQWAGDKVGNDWQNTYNNLDDYWKAGVDITRNGMSLGTDIAVSGIQDPTDINAWTDPAQDHLDDFNQVGDDIFGTGGWIKAGANVYTTGNPFQGAGSLGYQLDAAASGSDYNNGKTSGIADAVNMYNFANDVSNGADSGTLPSDSNTYLEQGPNGVVSVTPSNYYGTASSGVNIATNPTGNNMDYVNQSPTDVVGPEYGNFGYPSTLPEVNYDQSYGVGNSPYVSGSTPPSFLDQTKDFLNSTPGKLVRAGVSVANPTLGTLINGTTTGLNGNLGQAAFDTLGSLYMNNRAAKANRQYQDQMNSMLGGMSNLYSQNSPYAQQLRQELERKDAAAGRRSQYGQRETQLQAMLAEKQAGLTPMQNILTSQAMQGSIAQQQAARNRQIADLKSIFLPQKPGGQSQGSGAGLLQNGWEKVKDLWGSF